MTPPLSTARRHTLPSDGERWAEVLRRAGWVVVREWWRYEPAGRAERTGER